MEYQIVNIAPGRDVTEYIVTVSYWYGDFDRGLGRPADFTEDHVIGGLQPQRLKFNEVGQPIGHDGIPILQWEDVDGIWLEKKIHPNLIQKEEVDLLPLIEAPLADRARQVLAERPTGWGLMQPEDRISVNNLQHPLRNRPELKGLAGKAKRIR